MIELGRLYISTEVSKLSAHMALLNQVYLEAALHVISYVSLQHNFHLCMDPTYLIIGSTQSPLCNWSEFYGEIEVPIPPDALEATSKVVDRCMFVDSDHM